MPNSFIDKVGSESKSISSLILIDREVKEYKGTKLSHLLALENIVPENTVGVRKVSFTTNDYSTSQLVTVSRLTTIARDSIIKKWANGDVLCELRNYIASYINTCVKGGDVLPSKEKFLSISDKILGIDDEYVRQHSGYMRAAITYMEQDNPSDSYYHIRIETTKDGIGEVKEIRYNKPIVVGISTTHRGAIDFHYDTIHIDDIRCIVSAMECNLLPLLSSGWIQRAILSIGDAYLGSKETGTAKLGNFDLDTLKTSFGGLKSILGEFADLGEFHARLDSVNNQMDDAAIRSVRTTCLTNNCLELWSRDIMGILKYIISRIAEYEVKEEDNITFSNPTNNSEETLHQLLEINKTILKLNKNIRDTFVGDLFDVILHFQNENCK
jgi:hypothetical protein